MKPTHYFTLDVEDWYQVYYARSIAPIDSWPTIDSFIEAMIDKSLSLLSEQHVTATFFMVGYLAKRHPALIRKISDLGHEIASHGYWHDECHTFTDTQLRADIVQSKQILEDTIGKPVHGYRAPGYSIPHSQHQAIDMVQEAGYRYDSSLLGSVHHAYRIRPQLIEIPPNAFMIGNRCWPINGGCFFRMIPYVLYRPYVRYLEKKGIPLNFYIHSWELYPAYPRMALGIQKSFIQYFNLKGVEPKIRRLLKEFSFTSIEKQFNLSSADAMLHQIP